MWNAVTSNDSSIVNIVRAVFKAFLKMVTAKIFAPMLLDSSPPTITWSNGLLPLVGDTKAIRKYIHEGTMIKADFHGILCMEKPVILDLLTHPKINELYATYPTLKLSVALFGTSPVVMIGALYVTMALENREHIAAHVKSKMATYLQGKQISIQASWSKLLHGSPESHKSVYHDHFAFPNDY